jgi:hypothetical protein
MPAHCRSRNHQGKYPEKNGVSFNLLVFPQLMQNNPAHQPTYEQHGFFSAIAADIAP